MNQDPPTTDKSEVIPLRPGEGDRLAAADWLAKLDRGELTPDERRALARWIAEDPRNKHALRDMADLWYELNSPLSQLGIGVEGNTDFVPAKRVAMNRGASIRFVAAMVLSAFIGTVIIVAILSLQQPAAAYPRYATKIGETKTIALQDGSTIFLNTNTTLEQAYSKGERAIHLFGGEAIFDVAHNKGWPFVVYTNRGKIFAVGTKFAVRVERDKVSVEVTEGRVALEGNVKPAIGEKIKAAAKPAVTLVGRDETAELGRKADAITKAISDRELEDQMSWAQGRIVFHDKTLQSVVDEVARYTRVHIGIEDEELRGKKITGALRIGDLNQMLDGIKGSLGLSTVWISPSEVRLTRG